MPRMITWNDRKYFSLAHDAQMSRVSGFDENNQEHWMVITTGKGYADRRKQAVETIMEHIEAGDPPGEVQPEKE